MTFSEADKIFDIWRQWYWPFHFILDSIFFTHIPESFLPYPPQVLEEALNIIAKFYFDSGDIKTSEAIQNTMINLSSYIKDGDAYKQAAKNFSNTEMIEASLLYVENFKRDWMIWLEKQKS